jgi:hypothetical protein
MIHRALSDDELFKSFKAYERQVDKQVKAGEIRNDQARLYLKKARENYKKRSYNKYMDQIKCA